MVVPRWPRRPISNGTRATQRRRRQAARDDDGGGGIDGGNGGNVAAVALFEPHHKSLPADVG